MSKQNKKCSEEVRILGYGEIGKTIAKFYENPKIKDLNRNDDFEKLKVLHICIPWSDGFIKIVAKEIEEAKPYMVIIHSTVMPETTHKLNKIFKDSPVIVHSPIRGTHPDLYLGVKTFVKYIGADSKKAGEIAKEHLESLGLKVKVLQSSLATELGKLFDTSYYGLCIAWHGEMKEICDKAGVNFEETAIDFNRTYNEGYEKLGKKNVIRPVLYPPGGRIGGHCVVPNSKILKEYQESKALDLILKYQ